VTQAETGSGDDVGMEEKTSRSSSVPSFHAPVASDDVEALTSAERRVLERIQDGIDEKNFDLAQRLKKSVLFVIQ